MSALSKTQIGLLQSGAIHRDGVVQGGGRTGFERYRIGVALLDLEHRGFVEPNPHGDHYITDAGRAALGAKP